MKKMLCPGMMLLLMIAGLQQAGAATNLVAGPIFYLPFDTNAVAAVAGGNPQPLAESKLGELTEGIVGKGIKLDQQTLLRYAIPGNYSNARGSLEFWVKYLSGDQREPHYLFYEEGPMVAGSQILRMFTTSMTGNNLYYAFADDRGHWSYAPFSLADIIGEWHQVTLTWDQDIGDRLYIDGKFQPHRFDLVQNYRRGTKQYAQMTIGPRNDPIALVLDEVRIYDRMLTENEIDRHYREVMPVRVLAKPTVVTEGQATTVTVSLQNIQSGTISGEVRCVVTDAAGQPLGKEIPLSGVTLPDGGSTEIRVLFTPATSGVYRLNLDFSGAAHITRVVKLYALPRVKTDTASAVNPELKLKPVVSFDCTKSYGTNEFCDDGLSKVVDSPLGKYRESGDVAWSRFAYRFTVDSPNEPYLVEIEYPDDKERIMEYMIDCTNAYQADASAGGQYQVVENGVLTGGDLPNTMKMRKLALLFWPPGRECGFQVMNWITTFYGPGHPAYVGKKAAPAACRSIAVSKVVGGIPAVKLANQPEPGARRWIGNATEDPMSVVREFGFNMNRDMEQTYFHLKNRTDYMAFLGQNLMVHPLVFYAGLAYPSDRYFQSISQRSQYSDFWVDMALELCRAKGITFVPSICIWPIDELGKEAAMGPDREGVARGEDTVRQVAWNGELSPLPMEDSSVKYDILHPRVEATILGLVDDILERYGHHPAFGGLSFWMLPYVSMWFGNLHWGYSDRDIAMFEKETGIKVPGAVPDPKRFVQRYMFLVKQDPAMQEKWIAWRCKKTQELWMKVLQHLQAVNPKAVLTIETWALLMYDIPDFSIQYHWKPWEPESIYRYYRDGGLDLNLYKNIPGLLIGKCYYNNLRPNDENRYWKDVDLSPANIEPFQNDGANAVWLEQFRREFGHMQYATKMPGYWLNHQVDKLLNKSAAVMPSGDYYLEYYANALANLDVRYIADGGIVTTTLGHERELRDFIRAYRTIPAESFTVVGASNDPVCVRARQRPDGYYFYVVNREFYPVDVTLLFSAAEKFTITDLAADEALKVQKDQGQFKLRVQVNPFRVRSFRAPPGKVLSGFEVKVPDENLRWLNERMTGFQQMLTALQKAQLNVGEKISKENAWVIAEIEKAYREQRYSRFRHLLDSYEVKRMERMLKDKQLQSFLQVPKDYRQTVMSPRKYAVRSVDKIPDMDSPLWAKTAPLDKFSDLLEFDGQWLVKPADDKTDVAILYDREKIGLLFQCHDQHMERVIAKQVERDGYVTAPDDDSVELFIAHAAGNKPYYHFMVNFGGSRKDHRGYVGNTVYEDPRWYNPDWTFETRKLPDKWLALMTIPFKALEQTPAAGSVWGINVTRNKRSQGSVLQADLMAQGNGLVHCPNHFAQLMFE